MFKMFRADLITYEVDKTTSFSLNCWASSTYHLPSAVSHLAMDCGSTWIFLDDLTQPQCFLRKLQRAQIMIQSLDEPISIFLRNEDQISPSRLMIQGIRSTLHPYMRLTILLFSTIFLDRIPLWNERAVAFILHESNYFMMSITKIRKWSVIHEFNHY